MTPVGFGVLGANSFVANAAVLPAIEASASTRLVSVGSRSSATGYDDVLRDPDVEVVYLPLPNGMHAEWTARAAHAGKHVLCEKPLAPTATEAASMVAICAEAGVSLWEAWMTPFSPPWSDAIEHARAHGVDRVETTFTFTIGPDNDDNYRWNPEQGGGALLDVGIYGLGPAVELWGPDPERIDAEVTMCDRGVDLTVSASLRWSHGGSASTLLSFALPERQHLHLRGPEFDLELVGTAHTGVDGTYQRMIEAVARDVRGLAPFPRPAADAVAMIGLLDRIRAAGS